MTLTGGIMLKGQELKATDRIVAVKMSAWAKMMMARGHAENELPSLAIARVLNSRRSAASFARDLRARLVVRSPGVKSPSDALPRQKKTPRGGGGVRKTP